MKDDPVGAFEVDGSGFDPADALIHLPYCHGRKKKKVNSASNLKNQDSITFFLLVSFDYEAKRDTLAQKSVATS